MARVLVVDDDSLVRRLIERVLRDADHDVRGARHGAEALALAVEVLPDVVVTDFNMPHMNGAELLEALRKQFGDAAPPAVLVSGTLDLVLPSQKRDFAALLDKPFTPRELLEAVATCVVGPDRAARRRRSGTRLKAATDEILGVPVQKTGDSDD